MPTLSPPISLPVLPCAMDAVSTIRDRLLARLRGFAAKSLLFGAFVLAACAPLTAHSSNVQFVGTGGYTFSGNTATLNADEVANFSSSGVSGTLRLELWALAAPYAGGAFTGFKLAEYRLGALDAGFDLSNIFSGTIPFATPANGTYFFTLFVSEFTGAAVDDGFEVDDWINLPSAVTFGPVGPPPPALTPQVGLWWNPDESGSGYALDYKHGVIVMTVYSYLPNGLPQWYIASGPLSGVTWTGTLFKTLNGQCISCAYRPDVLNGNDGTVTVIFSSPTSATMYLPGGRITPIQPEAF